MEILCPDSIPAFLNFFDLSIAPSLLFYTYIPTIIISSLLGLFVFIKDKKSLLSKILLLITIFFSLWVLDIFILWVATYNDAIMFGWQITPILEVPIFLLSIYFTYIFTNKNRKDIKPYVKIILLAIMGAVFVLLPTQQNITSYDILSCEGILGNLWSFMYIFEFIAIAWVAGICIKNYRRIPKGDLLKNQIFYVGIGIVSFLVLFVSSNILGETLEVQQISFIGSIGMVLFLAFLAYLIIRYQAFNIKMIGAQALVIALVVLIGATLLVQDPFYSQIIIAITLVLVIGLGYSLTQSVKKEVKQREQIEELAENLEVANEKLKELDQLKSEFLSLATHQIRAPLTAIKGYSSMLLEGDFGVLPQKATDSVQTIMKSCQNLIKIVEDFLNISRIEQGRMVYEKSIFDIKEIVQEVIKEIKPNIDKAGLSLDLNIPVEKINVNADRNKIKQVIGNIVDNSIKYTPHGQINISVFLDGEKVKIAVKDSGTGIDPSEINKLFAKFSRTKEANKTSVTGTGLGLYVAKKIIEAHRGDIKIYSEGVGKGSTFTIELPAL
ncbi:MAG: Histidine kinase [Parcubacteria group bacterium GW2011_GWB1_35_5]|uniref:histidine kinase n=1 Tax=Candidatus Zambryskibacteria bacterium RIFCSPLOWO2_01_FULL_35_19 TaxID=1802757 RepID=A0A1G2TXU1_9BACT|nr:MAG: Histidine kinase [Parcubacteria group bacterium GW2011_GWC1_34_10]KKP80674.1 MAG: Histidine kinase [Parcubacteria group bacterium GW2011_GWB1_35_5]OHA86462.1 MAG: hypothetical protein A2726_02450 [Candidatus Zambryskibacteria bacterium RIFCSPHIGHO2_01_FULL_35_32]OHB01993.1 MAG: hypothetical protein A3A90_02015 [Candidatus Zambryskibacteria bacterium RIFCSPLOWO2_01_FULL_35_19]